MVEICAGSAAATRATILFADTTSTHSVRTNVLIIDYETQESLEASYPQLIPLLASGRITVSIFSSTWHR